MEPSMVARKPANSLPAPVEASLKKLGSNIKTARLRRVITMQELAEKVGVSRQIIAAIEKGNATTSIGSYIKTLWMLNLLDDLHYVADPDNDEEGKTLERINRPSKAVKSQRQELDNDF